MTITRDARGNLHQGKGAPDGGQFAEKLNARPAGKLTDQVPSLDSVFAILDGQGEPAADRAPTPKSPLAGVNRSTKLTWAGASHVTDPVIAEALAVDKDPEIRRRLAGQQGLAPHLVEQLAVDRDPYVRARVLTRSDVDPALIERAMADANHPVPSTLAGRAGLPQEFVDELAKRDDATMLVTLIKHPRLRADDVARLVLQTPPTGNGPIADDEAQRVQAHIMAGAAQRDELAPVIVDWLSRSQHQQVVYQVAQRRDLSDQVIDRIADPSGSPMAHSGLIGNPTVPLAKVRHLAASPSWPTRQALALRGDADTELLDVLSADAEPQVRVCAVRHKRLSNNAAIRTVRRDHSPDVLAAFMERRDFDAPVVRAMAASPNYKMRVAATQQEGTTVEVLAQLARDSSETVRRAVRLRAMQMQASLGPAST